MADEAPEPVPQVLARIENRLTVIETKLKVWQQMVIPMVTGFIGVVAGLLLAVVALRG